MSVDGQEEMLEQVQMQVEEELPNGTIEEREKLFDQLVEQRGNYGDFLYSMSKGD